jgi:hypothetical protein
MPRTGRAMPKIEGAQPQKRGADRESGRAQPAIARFCVANEEAMTW